jgi:hypothetical protein
MENPSSTQDKKKNKKKQKQSNQKHGKCMQSQQDGTSLDDDSSSQGARNAWSKKGLNGMEKKHIHLQHNS